MSNRKAPKIRDNTAAENADIRRQIAEDPDTWEGRPDRPYLKRGRPPGATKTQVTVRLDNDLIDALKEADEKGWQTRLNKAARKGMGI